MWQKWDDPVGESYYEELNILVDAATSSSNSLCDPFVATVDLLEMDRKRLDATIKGIETGGKSFDKL